MQCASCGFVNSERAKFCAECGTRLASEAAAAEAERRQLTVMFCDLVGSTTLSERLDPEELRDLLRDYQGRCARVVSRFGGHVAQYLGDGILVYFGYPEAHEDDARRAIETSLGILSETHGASGRGAGSPSPAIQ